MDKNSAEEYLDSNPIIFGSGSHSENKIGIYMMGGCDLPSVFSCVPLIKPILKGTCCILKEGQIEKSRSDLLLQNLKNYPQDFLAPVLEKFYLPANFFENQLFSPNFCVSNGSSFEEFPKQVVILSIAPDVTRVIYQHREHGFLIDPSGWWNNQPMDLMLRDLSAANWFRKHFVSLGRMTVEAFIESFSELIGQIQRVTNAHILVFNTLTNEPVNINHNYQFVKRPESLRRREFNLALIELSRKFNFWIVDIDKVLKQSKTKNMVDFAHFPVELYQPIGQEVFRILKEIEIFKVSIHPLNKLQQTQGELLKYQLALQHSQKHYTEKDVEQLLKSYIIQQFMQERGEAGLENDCLLIEEEIIDSLGILELINFIEKQFDIKVSTKEVVLENFVNINAIKSLIMSYIGALIEQVITPNKKENFTSLVPIKPNGNKRPLFYVHGLSGHGSYLKLGRYLHPDRPFYGLKAVGLDGEKAPYTRMEDMVAYYIQEIQTVQPEGPYLLGGLCIGGVIALEMAQQLRKRSQEVSLVVMADSPNPFWTEEEKIELANWLSSQKSIWRKEQINRGFSLQQVESVFRVRAANIQLISSYVPQVYSGRVIHFSALELIESLDEMTAQRAKYRHDPMQPNGWNSWVAGGIELHKVPGSHQTFFKEPHVRVLAEKLNACLEQVEREYESEKVLINLPQTQSIPEKFSLLTRGNELDSIDKIQQEQINQEPVQRQLQQAQEKLALTLAQLSASQAELAQLKSYLQQAQGVEGIISYYRSRIASNPDDIQLYHQALEVKPDDAQIYLQLGNALVRRNRFDDAIAAYQTAIQYHPDNFEIHLELGKTLEKQKKWDEAIASYRRAIELNPDDSRSHKHLGDILAERGQINEASVCYRRALQLQPRIF